MITKLAKDYSGLTDDELYNEVKRNAGIAVGGVGTSLAGSLGAVEKRSFTNFMATTGNKLISSTITDPKRKTQFIANLMTAISNNPTLQECDQVSVVAGALQAEALHFPLNNSLGYVYLVPFNDKKAGIKKAQFQIGYKGYIQLAIRSGLYKDINVIEVKEGELGNYDPLNGQTFNWINDYYKRRFASNAGYEVSVEKEGTDYRLTLKK